MKRGVIIDMNSAVAMLSNFQQWSLKTVDAGSPPKGNNQRGKGLRRFYLCEITHRNHEVSGYSPMPLAAVEIAIDKLSAKMHGDRPVRASAELRLAK